MIHGSCVAKIHKVPPVNSGLDLWSSPSVGGGIITRRSMVSERYNPTFPLFFSFLQKLQTFQSLSCPGFSSTEGSQPDLLAPTSENSIQSDFTALPELGLESRRDVARDDEEDEEDSSYEDLDSDSACSVDSRPRSPVTGNRTLWKGDCGRQRDIFQLGGELDLDQIERN